jgi:pyruvoyl-dependent arginine decarboxylase (PvlArgDC)
MTSTDPRNAIDVVIQLGGDCFMEKGGRTLLEQLIEDGKIQKSIKKGIVKEENIGKIGWCARYIAGANKEVAREIVSCINIDTLSSKIEIEEDASGNIVFCVVGIAAASKEAGLRLVDSVLKRIEIEEDIRMIGWCLGGIAVASEGVAREIVNRINVDVLLTKIEKEEDIGKIGWCVEGIAAASEEVAQESINRLNPKIREELQKRGWLK